MLSLQVLIPPHHDQTVKVNQRDVVGNMRIYIHDKQEEVPVSSLSNKRLFLRHPSGTGVWLDNSNVFSSYFISPNKDVLELRTVAAPPLQPSFTHRSCLKLIIPYYDYAAVFSDFLECPHTISVEAIKKALAALTLFNIADSDDTQLWYFWPQDHTLNQLPNPKTPIPSSPSSPALTYHQTYHTHAQQQHQQQRRINSVSSRSTSLPSSNSFPSISTSNSLASLGSSALSLSSSNLPTCTQLIPIPALTHPLQATPPQVNYIHIPKEPIFRDVEFEDRPSDNCEECKKDQERREEEEKKRKADEALRRVLYTPHTHLEFCVVWTPRVALLKSIKRRIVVLIHSLSVYKTLIFQHRTTVQDALQILTEFVQYAHQRTSEAGGDPEHQFNRPSDPTQKRYALFKDGVRLEEDKLLAELLDPQVLWTRVVCTFMEIGAVPKKHTATQITSPIRSSLDDVGENRRLNNPDVPDSDDCHLLILYRKQQAFRNFHFNPAISVGRAIKIISGGFNIPATTINQDDWSFRLRRNSSNGLRVTGDGETEGSGSSTSTPTGTPSSGGNTPADSSLSIVINNSNNINNNNGDTGSSPSNNNNNNNNNSISLPSTPASPAPISPKPSFPFSLFGGGKNASMLELSPVSSPVLSLMNTLALDGNSPISAASSAPAMSPPVNTSRVTPRALSISTMGGDLDNRHEYMLYDFHRHEWLDNDRTLASYKFHTKYTNFSGRSVAAASSSLPHITLSESVPVELQLRPRPRMRRMALIDGVDFTIPLDANANAVLVYSPTTTVAAAIDEVQTLSGIREPSLELFVRYNFTTSPQSPSTSPAFGASTTIANSPTSPNISSNVNSRVPFLTGGNGGNGGSNGSYNKLYVERVCLEFGKTLWSYNFLPTSTLEIFVEDEEKRDTEVLEEHALKAFGGHSTSFLPGEFTQHTRDHVTHFEERVGGECATGRLIITNYRLIFHSQNRSSYKELASDDIDVPLCTIDKVKPLQFSGGNQTTTGIDLTCKDMRNIMFGWRSDGGKNLANLLKRLIPSRQEDFFAFASKENFPTLGWDIYDAESEYKRIGITGSANFRLTRINRDYTLCPTYPSVFVVPASISDDMLTRVSSFREKGRIPAVSWLHPNGASITRCSQPRVGLGRARCVDDEMLLKALSSGSKTLYLIDSRPMANAMYNTIAGRGFETAELYPNCKLIFLGIGNIHVMRESFKKLVDLCLSRSTDDEGTHWLSALESTNWMDHARVILKSASLIVDLVEKKSCSVVTHCSDGWDRTSQIVALAELLLDPYFRSIRGFEILLEKEWLSFGHMFGARSGNWLEAGASKDNEFAPIFLLFLDAVYKVMMQYPTAFEFNENFLLTIADSVYNCRFGTFLYNSEKERMDMNLKSRTVSLWAYIASNKRNFTNPHFNPQTQQRVLFPSIKYPKLSFWSGYYLRFVKSFTRSSDSVDARTWQLIDENAALKAHIEKLQAGVIP